MPAEVIVGIVGVIVTLLVGVTALYPAEVRDALDRAATDTGALVAAVRRGAGASVWAVRQRVFRHQRAYKVGFFDYNPLSKRTQSLDGGEHFEGLWPRLMTDVAAKMGINIEIVGISATGFQYPRKLEHDIVMGLFRTGWREKYFAFSQPFHRVRLQGLCRIEHPPISKEDLLGDDIGIVVQPGEIGWEYVEAEIAGAKKRKDKIKLAPLSKTYEIMMLLPSREWDVAISDEISCLHYLEQQANASHFKLAFDWPLPSFEVCIAIRKGVMIDMKNLNAALKEARNAPEFRELERSELTGRYKAAIEKVGIT